MTLSKKAHAGDGGNAIVGNQNSIGNQTINLFDPNLLPTTKRSALFEICSTIAEKEIEYNDDYSLFENVDWTEKLEFNNVDIYSNIFDTYSDGYMEIEEVLQSYNKREIMVKKIHTLYLKSEKKRIENDEDGDFVLDLVFDEIKTIIQRHAHFNNSDLLEENIDEAIYLIMFYIFTKCKLLKKPPKEGVDF